jgi:hypothetical protein
MLSAMLAGNQAALAQLCNVPATAPIHDQPLPTPLKPVRQRCDCCLGCERVSIAVKCVGGCTARPSLMCALVVIAQRDLL